jgi:hypothetical protein
MAWTDRYVTTSGNNFNGGTSEVDAWDLPTAFSNASAGMRINIKAGTYSYFSSFSMSTSGTRDSCIWLRGYKTTIGDLDEKFTGDLTNSTDIPLIQANDYSQITVSGQHTFISGLSFESQSTNYSALYDSGAYGWRKNCRFHNAYNGANEALDGASFNKLYLNCSFTAAGTAGGSNFIGLADCQNDNKFVNCLFEATQSDTFHGLYMSWGGGNVQVINCIFKNLKSGIYMSGGANGVIVNNTFVDIAGNAIFSNFNAGSPSDTNTSSLVASNYFDSVSGYCVGGGSAGSGVEGILVANNCYRNSATKFQNTGDMVEFDALADASEEFTDSANGDYSIKSTSSGYDAGLGGYWSLGTTDYRDVGAAQHQSPSGGGGGGATVHPLRSN